MEDDSSMKQLRAAIIALMVSASIATPALAQHGGSAHSAAAAPRASQPTRSSTQQYYRGGVYYRGGYYYGHPYYRGGYPYGFSIGIGLGYPYYGYPYYPYPYYGYYGYPYYGYPYYGNPYYADPSSTAPPDANSQPYPSYAVTPPSTSVGATILRNYGLKQTPCGPRNLVVILGLGSSAVCAFPNNVVGPGNYTVDASTLSLVSQPSK